MQGLPEKTSGSPRLVIDNFRSIDEFYHTPHFAAAKSIPLDLKSFKAMRAFLSLPGCDFSYAQTFRRILDGEVDSQGLIVSLQMADLPPPKVNGLALDNHCVIATRGRCAYKIVDEFPNRHVTLRFSSSMRERGWPDIENTFRVYRAPPAALLRLQTLIQTLFNETAIQPDGPAIRLAQDNMLEAIIATLDEVFLGPDGAAQQLGTSWRMHERVIDKIDALLATHPEAPIYSQDVAGARGVSVRTLHNATASVRGMSLHRYLKLRRLWSVRGELAVRRRRPRSSRSRLPTASGISANSRKPTARRLVSGRRRRWRGRRGRRARLRSPVIAAAADAGFHRRGRRAVSPKPRRMPHRR